MKKRILATMGVIALSFCLLVGCGTNANPAEPAAESETDDSSDAEGDAASSDSDSAEASSSDAPEEDAEYTGPDNFVSEQSGVLEFKDYDDVISHLTADQGYAYIKLTGQDEEVLAVTELVFLADKSAYEACLFNMVDGKCVSLGVVTGNGSAFPLRAEDGILYGGDNHNYSAYFLTEDGFLMMKDYVSDGDGAGEFSGFLRDENSFDKTNEFEGGQKEFDALLAKRDAAPIVEFTVVE